MKRIYNRKKDLRDYRDKLYTNPGIVPPPSVDLFPYVPMILDQGNAGSCTAHGTAGCFQFLEANELRDKDTNMPEEFGNTFTPVSRMMIYAGERIMEGTLNSDDGAQVRDGIKFLAANGVCSERTWPYDLSKLYTVPSAQAYAEASGHKIVEYNRLVSLDDMKSCLAQGFPFVFGTWLYNSFENTDSTGIVYMPQPGEEEIGGHCMYCVGYNDQTQMFVVVNSWGDSWGDKGRCYFPYAYMGNPNLTDDLWMIKK